MSSQSASHLELTAVRSRAFVEFFGAPPVAFIPAHTLSGDESIVIDVLVFAIEPPSGPAVAAVTNGMSDGRMNDPGETGRPLRRELVQYFPACTPGHARRLRDMAWLPHFDGFLLDARHTIAWPHAAMEGTPWVNAFFLEPILRSHRAFRFEIEGDKGSLLWHVPLSQREYEFKREHGADALMDRMDAARLPWVFDEGARREVV